MERPITYALIGCGRIAPNHIAAVRNNGLDLAAVCDPVAQRMEAVLAALPAQDRQPVPRYTD